MILLHCITIWIIIIANFFICWTSASISSIWYGLDFIEIWHAFWNDQKESMNFFLNWLTFELRWIILSESMFKNPTSSLLATRRSIASHEKMKLWFLCVRWRSLHWFFRSTVRMLASCVEYSGGELYISMLFRRVSKDNGKWVGRFLNLNKFWEMTFKNDKVKCLISCEINL